MSSNILFSMILKVSCFDTSINKLFFQKYKDVKINITLNNNLFIN